MNCNIIFYMARRTGNCEISLTRKLSAQGIEVLNIYPASNPLDFGKMLHTSLKTSNLLFIISGSDMPENADTETLISNAFADLRPLPKVAKIRNVHNEDRPGYILQRGRQKIILLPDFPIEIEEMVSKPLLNFVCADS